MIPAAVPMGEEEAAAETSKASSAWRCLADLKKTGIPGSLIVGKIRPIEMPSFNSFDYRRPFAAATAAGRPLQSCRSIKTG